MADNSRMHLTPRERERLLLAAAADLARRRLARGARLGATEAVALVCDEACEMAWDGVPLEDVIERARQVIDPRSLLPGVAVTDSRTGGQPGRARRRRGAVRPAGRGGLARLRRHRW